MMRYLTRLRLPSCGCGRDVTAYRWLRGCVRTCTTKSPAPTTATQLQVRVRFAPSPTGQLHLGGLRTALYNFMFARAHGGRFILRLEDTDQTRLVPGAAEKLVEMLEWSGIQIDEGPGFGGDVGPYVQSKRINLYWENIQPLLQSGAAYYCFCTSRRLELLKKDALRRGEVPKYDNRCRHLPQEETEAKLKTNVPYVIRFKLESHSTPWQDAVYGPITQDVAAVEGDPVLLKTDRFPTYHYASVVDDHLMGVTHVMRGVEWQPSTTKHILLYKALGWKPPQFAHLPLLMNRDGTKLSKRQNGIHVQHFKDQGYFADSVLNLLTSTGAGFTIPDTAGLTMQELIDSFDLSLLRTNSTKLELERVEEYSRRHLQRRLGSTATRHQVVRRVKEMAEQRLADRYKSGDSWRYLLEDTYIERVLDHCQTRITILDDLFSDKLSFLWFVPDHALISDLLSEVVTMDTTSRILSETLGILQTQDEAKCGDSKHMASVLKTLPKQLGVNMKSFMTVLRVSLTGLKEGPGVAEIITILGKDASLRRIQQCLHGLSDTIPAETENAKECSS